jgi:septal ring factor EnvC (AmiA/AmiB activator)
MVWSVRMATVGDLELLTHHAGWALIARYAQHVGSLLQGFTATSAHLRLRLEECVDQMKVKNRAINNIQKGKRELLQKNAHFEMHVKELSDQLMRTYHSCDFKADDLDDTHTRLQHAQDELSIIQSYVHHLEIELHGRHEQLEASQAQDVDWQHEVEHL